MTVGSSISPAHFQGFKSLLQPFGLAFLALVRLAASSTSAVPAAASAVPATAKQSMIVV